MAGEQQLSVFEVIYCSDNRAAERLAKGFHCSDWLVTFLPERLRVPAHCGIFKQAEWKHGLCAQVWLLCFNELTYELCRWMVRQHFVLYYHLPEQMQYALTISSDIDCPICFEPCQVYMVLPCGHLLCKACICQLIKNQQFKCPMCRKTYK